MSHQSLKGFVSGAYLADASSVVILSNFALIRSHDVVSS